MPEAYTITDQKRMARAVNYFAWQARLVTPELGRRVIEVGCGIGNFTAALLSRDLVVALDVERECIQRLEERYPAWSNLHTMICEPGDIAFKELARYRPDSCVCLNVLEHIEDDRRAMDAMSAVLSPGGAIILLVPAFPALYGPIDRNLDHFRRYSVRRLGALARECGLRIEKIHYVNSIGFFGWWVNARLFRLEAQSEGQIEIFDRWIVPWLSRLEAKAPPPFGQSLFAVLRKP